MSYEIVKKIRIEDNKVYLTSESNNVFPKYYKEWECKGLSEVLQNEGIEALNFEILKDYEAGNMQPGTPNKWSRAIDRLRETKEYQRFNWRNRNYNDDNCPIEAARKTEEYRKILLSSLALKPDATESYIISKNTYGQELYILRVTTRQVKFTTDKTKSKIFKKKDEVNRLVNMFPEFTATPNQ